jgi:hypothetical protein
MQNITVRRTLSADRAELSRLAALDSASPPRGPALVAETDSRIVAALPLGPGRAIADPFERTAELVALLELRRSQINAAQSGSRGWTGRLRAPLRRRAPNGTLPA